MSLGINGCRGVTAMDGITLAVGALIAGAAWVGVIEQACFTLGLCFRSCARAFRRARRPPALPLLAVESFELRWGCVAWRRLGRLIAFMSFFFGGLKDMLAAFRSLIHCHEGAKRIHFVFCLGSGCESAGRTGWRTGCAPGLAPARPCLCHGGEKRVGPAFFWTFCGHKGVKRVADTKNGRIVVMGARNGSLRHAGSRR